MQKLKLTVALLFALTLQNCTDSQTAKLTGFGNKYRIEVVSGGQIIRTYESTGKVSSEKDSDGYFFKDAQTGKLVEVSGQVIITQID